MIAVMGATGRVGGTVLQALAGSGRPLRAISRKPAPARAGVEQVAADAFDIDALTRAFTGVEAAFVMNPIAPDAADVYAEADKLSATVAEALRRAQVPHVVALCSQGAHLPEGTGVVATLHGFEQTLLATGLPLTRLRPAYFMESWLPFAGIAAETGQMPALLDPMDRAIPTVSVRDVGAIAADFLLHPQPGVANLMGPAEYSDQDAAMLLAGILGRDVTLAPVPADQVAGLHEQAGLGASLSEGTAAMYRAINAGQIPFGPADMVRRGTTSLRDVLMTLLDDQRAVA